jgi:hypothetical protein
MIYWEYQSDWNDGRTSNFMAASQNEIREIAAKDFEDFFYKNGTGKGMGCVTFVQMHWDFRAKAIVELNRVDDCFDELWDDESTGKMLDEMFLRFANWG